MKSVRFYKRLIVSATAALILIPTAATVLLVARNRELSTRLETAVTTSDESVTVGAMQIEPAGIARSEPVLSYQTLYPDFSSEFFGFAEPEPESRTVYLTFDDGPSAGTAAILDVLDRKGVKATFFVNGRSNRLLADLVGEMAARGHTVGMHGYSHRYQLIYSNLEYLLDDFYRNFRFVISETGSAPEIMRFPGGSINIFNIDNYQAIVAEMLRRGFIYYDWNVSAGDAVNGATAKEITDHVVNGVRIARGPAFVLMHDNGNEALREALDPIIDTLQREGYRLEKLDNSVKPPMFIYPD